MLDGGAVIDRYELLVRHEADGLATAWTALFRDRSERLVELVRLDPYVAEVSEFRNAFLKEAAALRRVTHAGFLSLRMAEAIAGSVFGIRNYVEKLSLAELASLAAERGEPIPAAALVRIAVEALSVLGAVHSARDAGDAAMHGDLTPAHLFVTAQGGVLVAQSALGVAASRPGCVRPPGRNERLRFKAPEQLAPSSGVARKLDGRVDLFSLGVILWEALAGRPLFEGASDEETLALALTAPIPSVQSVRRVVDPPLPPGLDALLARVLSRDPLARFGDTREMIDALRRIPHAMPAAAFAELIMHLAGPSLEARRDAVGSARSTQPAARAAQKPQAAAPVVAAPLAAAAVVAIPQTPVPIAAPYRPKIPGATPRIPAAAQPAAPAPAPRVPFASPGLPAPPAVPVVAAPPAAPEPAADEDLIDVDLIEEGASASYVGPTELPRGAPSAPVAEAAKVVVNVPIPVDSAAERLRQQRSAKTMKISREQLAELHSPEAIAAALRGGAPAAPTFGAPTFGAPPAGPYPSPPSPQPQVFFGPPPSASLQPKRAGIPTAALVALLVVGLLALAAGAFVLIFVL